MCWIGEDKKYITDRRIRAYKILIKIGNKYFTPYQETEVYAGLRAKADIVCNKLVYSEFIAISEGLHSLANLDAAKEACKYITSESSLKGDIVIVQCIIPIGSEFYINFRDQIVSNKLIYPNIIK